MIVFDRTTEFLKLLQVPTHKLFCFNHAVLLTEKIKIYVVRVIYSNKHNHPWKIWGSDYYGGHSRTDLGSFIVHNLGITVNPITGNLFDSTAILIYDVHENIIMATNKLFLDVWNQDCRIVLNQERIMLTYNGRVNGHIVMLSRELIINSDHIKLTPERYLSVQFCTGIEKNWVLWDKYICYAINGTHVIINQEGVQYRFPVPNIRKIIEKYGKKNIFFSLSCPPIKFNDHEILAVGHLKIKSFTKYQKKLPFNEFLKQIHLFDLNANLKKYSRYTYSYFLYFYTFDPSTFEVKRISDALIPIQDHEPYTLVFPLSLVNWKNEFIVTYGEGDVRCKELTLKYDEVDNLLRNIHKIKPKNYRFRFLF